MVAQRILEPGSKLAAARLFRPETAVSTLASQLGLPENAGGDRLCETMDWLLERQPRIEKALAEKHLNEGSPVLYDLTSVWSYSRTCPLVDRGCSRDGKKGLPQIEFGLLCDAEGRPVAVEAFPGNASDPSTVAAQVGKLRDRFGLKRAVFVGDRGMITQARVREDLEPNGCDWIFALRASGVGALAENGALQPTLFDERDMAEIECRELFPGERLVVCRNPLLAEERTRKRKDLEQRIKACLDSDGALAETVAVLRSVPGIGLVACAMPVAEMPELGRISGEQAAALAGLAPVARDSGQMHGKRMIGGGRRALRCVLHQAALVASIRNKDLKVFADRLRKEGKPHKVVAAAGWGCGNVGNPGPEPETRTQRK